MIYDGPHNPPEYPLARAIRLRDTAMVCGAHPLFIFHLRLRVIQEAQRVWTRREIECQPRS